MKQAILITAYKEFDLLKKLINSFDDDFELYIHIDKKSLFSTREIKTLCDSNNVVFLSQEYKINWGGLNHLKSIILLSKEAIKNKNIEYFHLISGQDLLIMNCNNIKHFLKENKGKEFLQFFTMPTKFWSGDGGMSRVNHFNFYDLFNAKTTIGRKIIKRLMKLQRKLKINRRIQKNSLELFGGSTWWTLSYPCLKYVLYYTNNNPYFFNRLKYSFCSEEIYFQTIIMNSHFKKNVVNNNLRYIDWNKKNGSLPAIVDETDYNNIINSGAIFARKFQHPVSDKLINKIEEYIKTPDLIE